MNIFENDYVSFLILYKDLTGRYEHAASSASKKIKVNVCGGKYRQDLLNLFGADYEKNLKDAALKRNK